MSSGIPPVKWGGRKNIVCDKSSAVENSFSSRAKAQLLRSIVKKSSARAARQNVLLLWRQELEAGEGWHEWAFQMF